MSSSASETAAPLNDKSADSTLNNVHTNERVPGHPCYDEKTGLRTHGDAVDRDSEPPVSDHPTPFILPISPHPDPNLLDSSYDTSLSFRLSPR